MLFVLGIAFLSASAGCLYGLWSGYNLGYRNGYDAATSDAAIFGTEGEDE